MVAFVGKADESMNNGGVLNGCQFVTCRSCCRSSECQSKAQSFFLICLLSFSVKPVIAVLKTSPEIVLSI